MVIILKIKDSLISKIRINTNHLRHFNKKNLCTWEKAVNKINKEYDTALKLTGDAKKDSSQMKNKRFLHKVRMIAKAAIVSY